MEVLCVGVDPNRKALALYAQLLSQLQSRLVDEGITLRHKVHP
jgi:hypothetical protein